jgi:signal transduction histidine kinase
VRDILRQLLDFSMPPRGACGPLDLAAAAEQTKGLVIAQSRYDAIEIELVSEENLPAVIADDGMVAQILLNLMLNAADAALDGTTPPRIRITLRAAPLETRHGEGDRVTAGREHFDAVECAVADSGCGVAEENRERIFDPFFTTKDPGVGTGLGLANVLKFAQDMNGVIALSEESPLAGAEFVFRLPTEAPFPSKVRGDA